MNTMLEYLYAGQELYGALLGPLRTRYQLTTTELLVLLCLANDPQHDTARDIVETLRIAKSHVSVSVRALEKRGYIEGAYQGSNRRTLHLRRWRSSRRRDRHKGSFSPFWSRIFPMRSAHGSGNICTG